MSIKVFVADKTHHRYAGAISDEMADSARMRGTGIARRTPEYLMQKMSEGKAVIALDANGEWAGFCYVESWQSGKYVANSGLIVAPEYRNHGVARRIKEKIFELSARKYPDSKLFGLTTGLAVMKINTELGYRPVTYSELTTDVEFWKGCQSCVNFKILESKDYKNCLCTAMVFDPASKVRSSNSNWKFKERLNKVFPRLKRLKQNMFLPKSQKSS